MKERMNWQKLLSTVRVSNIGVCAATQPTQSQYKDPISQFERDVDQIIFSYPFRRLQDKTQVIPFPEFDFVHTRLTHSLEVASVGRSFGKLVADTIFEEENDYLTTEGLTKSDIGALIAGACLAHDIGNPPFGHSGEDSISYYFKETLEMAPEWLWAEESRILENEFEYKIRGERSTDTIRVTISDYAARMKFWEDFAHYEGNANGFRILTQNCEKGINPTVALLGTFTKYPRESYLSSEINQKRRPGKSQSKHCFFQSEKDLSRYGTRRNQGTDAQNMFRYRATTAYR